MQCGRLGGEFTRFARVAGLTQNRGIVIKQLGDRRGVVAANVVVQQRYGVAQVSRRLLPMALRYMNHRTIIQRLDPIHGESVWSDGKNGQAAIQGLNGLIKALLALVEFAERVEDRR